MTMIRKIKLWSIWILLEALIPEPNIRNSSLPDAADPFQGLMVNKPQLFFIKLNNSLMPE